MATYIEKELQLVPTLVSGKVGEFSVYWNGKKVLAKGDPDCQNGFPSPEEIIRRITSVRRDEERE